MGTAFSDISEPFSLRKMPRQHATAELVNLDLPQNLKPYPLGCEVEPAYMPANSEPTVRVLLITGRLPTPKVVLDSVHLPVTRAAHPGVVVDAVVSASQIRPVV
jgi:hypothetical protein